MRVRFTTKKRKKGGERGSGWSATAARRKIGGGRWLFDLLVGRAFVVTGALVRVLVVVRWAGGTGHGRLGASVRGTSVRMGRRRRRSRQFPLRSRRQRRGRGGGGLGSSHSQFRRTTGRCRCRRRRARVGPVFKNVVLRPVVEVVQVLVERRRVCALQHIVALRLIPVERLLGTIRAVRIIPREIVALFWATTTVCVPDSLSKGH